MTVLLHAAIAGLALQIGVAQPRVGFTRDSVRVGDLLGVAVHIEVPATAAPAKPWRPRATVSISMDGARAHSTDIAACSTSPASSVDTTLRRTARCLFAS